MEPITFEVKENILWDNWGRYVVAFAKGQVCSGRGEFDEKGNLIYASAESPIFEGVSDEIPVESISLLAERKESQ